LEMILLTARLLLAGAVALSTACLAQAVLLVPPWCMDTDGRPAALSADHRWILAADTAEQSLPLYDDKLKIVRQYPLAGLDGPPRGTALTIVNAPPRNSFIVVLHATPEIWEISYDPNAAPIFDGLVHDYRMGEGLARPGFLGIRRTLLRTPLTEPAFTADYSTVIGLARHTGSGGVQARIVNLDVRRELGTATLASSPEHDASFAVTANGRTWHANRSRAAATESTQRLMRYCTP